MASEKGYGVFELTKSTLSYSWALSLLGLQETYRAVSGEKSAQEAASPKGGENNTVAEADRNCATGLPGKFAGFKCNSLRANHGCIGFCFGFHFFSCLWACAFAEIQIARRAYLRGLVIFAFLLQNQIAQAP